MHRRLLVRVARLGLKISCSRSAAGGRKGGILRKISGLRQLDTKVSGSLADNLSRTLGQRVCAILVFRSVFTPNGSKAVAAAAKRLNISPFELFRRAYLAWHHSAESVATMERHYCAHVFDGLIPAWVLRFSKSSTVRRVHAVPIPRTLRPHWAKKKHGPGMRLDTSDPPIAPRAVSSACPVPSLTYWQEGGNVGVKRQSVAASRI
jgi:hypothetical protein